VMAQTASHGELLHPLRVKQNVHAADLFILRSFDHAQPGVAGSVSALVARIVAVMAVVLASASGNLAARPALGIGRGLLYFERSFRIFMGGAGTALADTCGCLPGSGHALCLICPADSPDGSY
jgi:hypothetical protein